MFSSRTLAAFRRAESERRPLDEQIPEATTAPMALRAQSIITDGQHLLPGANVARIMSRELPAGSKISRDAEALMQELATEFICFIMSEAKDMSLTDGRRSITSMDLVNACEELDLGEFVGGDYEGLG